MKHEYSGWSGVRKLAKKFGFENSISTTNNSVFDLPFESKSCDVVYSWGVLHHTGDMWSAITETSRPVSETEGSQLAPENSKNP